jgi:hypothetical protein
LREMELLLNSLDKANPALLKEGKEALYQSIEKLRNMPSNSAGQNSEQHTQGV